MNFLDDPANKNIVDLIIDLAHRFNLNVIAEGVEDAATATALKNINCDEFRAIILQGQFDGLLLL